MNTREEVIKYCFTLSEVYEDYPFHDNNMTVMRCKGNKKSFALIYRREEYLWINVKAAPEWINFWRDAYTSIIPGYHMNKQHWNSIKLDNTVPENVIQQMISESYELVKPKNKRNK